MRTHAGQAMVRTTMDTEEHRRFARMSKQPALEQRAELAGDEVGFSLGIVDDRQPRRWAGRVVRDQRGRWASRSPRALMSATSRAVDRWF